MTSTQTEEQHCKALSRSASELQLKGPGPQQTMTYCSCCKSCWVRVLLRKHCNEKQNVVLASSRSVHLHGPQKMTLSDFGNPITFPLVSP